VKLKKEQTEFRECLLSFGQVYFDLFLLPRNLKIKTYRNIMLPAVLYECETWFPALREKHRLRVFENRMPRKAFGPKRDEATGKWKRWDSKEFHDLYSSPNIVRVIISRTMRWRGARSTYGRKVRCLRILLCRNLRKRNHF
jgi:hypothetical protein